MRGGRVVLIALCVAGTAVALAPAASAATFSNPEAIKTSSFTNDSGPLFPYPSQIFVQGQQGTVVKAAVTLTRIAHERIDELRAILVAPGGQAARFMAEVCAQQDTTTNPLTFTFDDSAGSSLPGTAPCTSGTYRSSDHTFSASTFDYPYPAPPHPYPPTLAGMTGAEPNGAWKLFMFDGTIGESGSIEGGWSLDLTTTGAPAAKKKCKKKHKRPASAAKKKRCKKKR
jgi:subtilisin-like proprotein convertase family protein